jgi:hypothetical protein
VRTRDLDGMLVVAILAQAAMLIILAAPPMPVQLLFGLLLVFVLPGHALTAALFPAEDLRLSERVLMAVGLSLVVSVLSALLLNLISAGLQASSWAVLLSVITVAALIPASHRQPWRKRSTLKLREAVREVGDLRSSLLFGAALLIAGAAIVMSWNGARTLDARYTFTQMWIQPTGSTDRAAEVHVRNMERQPLEYRLVLTAGSAQVGQPSSFRLQPGQEWRSVATLPPRPLVGDRVVAALYRQDEPGNVYRRVELSRGG